MFVYSLYYSIQVDLAIFLHRLYFGEILRLLPPLEKFLVTPLFKTFAADKFTFKRDCRSATIGFVRCKIGSDSDFMEGKMSFSVIREKQQTGTYSLEVVDVVQDNHSGALRVESLSNRLGRAGPSSAQSWDFYFGFNLIEA